MEVVCSLDDVARVLADDGYNITDDTCFGNAADLPSMLGALDSPDSFPESPCSDEDIARVLDITRMTSPLLLASCARDTFQCHLSNQPNANESYDTNLNKTRDPCITNAVLNNSLLNGLPQFSNRGPQSLDIFSLALNCPLSDDTSHFNTFANSKENNDILNNYFSSSSALSPLSETDTILPSPSEPFAKYPQQISHHTFDLRFENSQNNQVSYDLSCNNESICVSNTINNVEICPSNNQVPPQPKRKRRRKGCPKAPKPKKKKQDVTNVTPKPKAKAKSKGRQETDPTQMQQEPNSNQVKSTEPTVKRQSPNKGSKRSTKAKKEGTNIETVVETHDIVNGGITETNPSDQKIPENNQGPSTTEIGSTNGVTGESKGPRRSSRATKNTENYNFRASSIVKRVETERKQQEPRQPKGKAKPPPLSKYRRRTANARERDRMKEINDAFDNLKDALPEMEPEDSKQKNTKFTILQLALNYISSLQDILRYAPSPTSTFDDTDALQATQSTVSSLNGDISSTELKQSLQNDNSLIFHSNTMISCIENMAGHDIVQPAEANLV